MDFAYIMSRAWTRVGARRAVPLRANAMMRAEDVIEVLHRLEDAGVEVWLDGGWGVDALLVEQTREHDDLDVVMALENVAAAQRVLDVLGYKVTEDEEWPTRFVMGDPSDRRIDFHTVTFDAEGGGLQRLQDGSHFRYPPEGLQGEGTVGGRQVRCLTPALQVRCHQGYEPDENDHRDMLALQQRFGVELPAQYNIGR